MSDTKPESPSGRIHTCDVCGKEGAWKEGWEWWGSYNSDECGHRLNTCSDECRMNGERIGMDSLWMKKYGCCSDSTGYRYPQTH